MDSYPLALYNDRWYGHLIINFHFISLATSHFVWVYNQYQFYFSTMVDVDIISRGDLINFDLSW